MRMAGSEEHGSNEESEVREGRTGGGWMMEEPDAGWRSRMQE